MTPVAYLSLIQTRRLALRSLALEESQWHSVPEVVRRLARSTRRLEVLSCSVDSELHGNAVFWTAFAQALQTFATFHGCTSIMWPDPHNEAPLQIHYNPYTSEGARYKKDIDMAVLRVMASRHSAFYSPLLGAIAGGFLQEEGFDPVYTPLPAGKTVAQLLMAGEIDVAQSAVSSSWGPLEQGQQPPTVHFAQINERDGFLIAGRHPDPAFSWDKLLSGGFMFVHGGQPQAMLAYAMHKQGVDLAQAQAVNAGTTANMMAAWRQGQGAYFHEQGPYPQQLEHEQVAHIVASVGEVLGPVAFSSLTATREWLQKPEARRFMRAYRKAREWVNTTAAAEVARAEQGFFPDVDPHVLTQTIAYYQQLGCWNPSVTISRATYEVALDVFLHSRLITKRHPYEQVVVPPPEA